MSAITRALTLFLSFSLLLLGGCTKETTQRLSNVKIVIEKPWVRAVPPVAKTSAAYFTIHNHTSQEEKVLSAHSPIAEATEFHTVTMQGEMMLMHPVKEIIIPAKGMTELKPGSFHIMFVNLKEVPKVGEKVPLTLKFQNIGEMQLMVPVQESPMPHDEKDQCDEHHSEEPHSNQMDTMEHMQQNMEHHHQK